MSTKTRIEKLESNRMGYDLHSSSNKTIQKLIADGYSVKPLKLSELPAIWRRLNEC